MQTPNRKLLLHRETVRVLTAQVLGLARGGKGGRPDDTGDIVHLPDTLSPNILPSGQTNCHPSDLT